MGQKNKTYSSVSMNASNIPIMKISPKGSYKSLLT